jgi:hypothetical protein
MVAVGHLVINPQNHGSLTMISSAANRASALRSNHSFQNVATAAFPRNLSPIRRRRSVFKDRVFGEQSRDRVGIVAIERLIEVFDHCACSLFLWRRRLMLIHGNSLFAQIPFRYGEFSGGHPGQARSKRRCGDTYHEPQFLCHNSSVANPLVITRNHLVNPASNHGILQVI